MKKYMQSLNEYYYEAFFSLDNDEEVEMRVDNDDLKKEIIDLNLEFSSSEENLDYSKNKHCLRFFYSFEEKKYFAEVEVFYNDVEYLQNEDLSKEQVEKLNQILKKLGLELYPTQEVK